MRVSKEFLLRCGQIKQDVARISGHNPGYEDVSLVFAKMPSFDMNIVVRRGRRRGQVEEIYPVKI